MNRLVRHQIERFLKRYAARRFDQDDVKLLLIDLRDMAPKDSLARELGDFLAHPHGRTKGIAWNLLERAYAGVLHNFDEIRPGSPQLTPLCTESEIVESVACALSDAGFDPSSMTSSTHDGRAKDFLLCVIGLLSASSILIQGAVHPLSVSLGGDGTQLVLTATVEIKKNDRSVFLNWPILTTSCRLHHEHLRTMFPWGTVQCFVARRSEAGHLTICRLESDNS